MDLKTAVFLCALLGATSAQPTGVARSLVSPHIVNGTSARIEDYPYQLSLEMVRSHVCGASLVSASYAVTAAHCVDGMPLLLMRVRAGSSLTFIINWSGQTSNIQTAVAHPKWNSQVVDYDAAVIALQTPFQLDNAVKPIALPDDGDYPAEGSTGVVSGWGTTGEGGLLTTFYLRKVDVPIFTRQQCLDAQKNPVIPITDRMLCAGNGHGDSCQGDSGGPLALASNGKLVGIVSWGEGCNRPGATGMYANVAQPEIRAFIRAQTGGL